MARAKYAVVAAGSKQHGFTLIEILVVVATMGILVATAIPNFQILSRKGYDAAARSDFRNLKIGVMNAMTQPTTPTTFSFSRLKGPRALPFPLAAVQLSFDTEASLVHQTRFSRTRQPTTSTSITVQNLRGSKIYRFTEVNGVITEQVVGLPE